MHDASNRLRYLYGLGGLSDGLGGSPGLGIQLQFNNQMLVAAMSSFQQQNIGLQDRMFTASDAADPTNPQMEGVSTAAVCNCAISEAERLFSVPAAARQQLQMSCAGDPMGFLAAMQAQARAQGFDFDAPACARGETPAGAAWYKDPKKLGLAAVVGAVGLFGLWVAVG